MFAPAIPFPKVLVHVLPSSVDLKTPLSVAARIPGPGSTKHTRLSAYKMSNTFEKFGLFFVDGSCVKCAPASRLRHIPFPRMASMLYQPSPVPKNILFLVVKLLLCVMHVMQSLFNVSLTLFHVGV